MRVLKFGGSSVANPERIRGVTDIVLSALKEEPIIVVVSAFQGISNQLLQCAQTAAEGDADFEQIFQEISQRHYAVIQALIPKNHSDIMQRIEALLQELHGILQGIFLLKELTLAALDHIAGFGERLSANIMAAYFNQHHPSEYVDSRQFIFTDDLHTHANVLFDETNAAIRQYFEELLSVAPIIPVTTGFIGSGTTGRTTTLGRNSSDYTATIIGAALDANSVEIWTDVDGVYSADPRYVRSAFIVPHLTFSEAIELSYFGAKVLHPATFVPVIEKQIPIYIKNTLNPQCPGTFIARKKNKLHKVTKRKYKHAAKSISAIDDVTLLIWKGSSAIDVASTIERLFKALTLAKINILLIFEGSPKHTICLAISQHEMLRAKVAIQSEFNLELQHQLISYVEKASQSIIAIIGDEIKNLSPEVAGKMFQALGKVQININAIMHGASERNLSLVVDSHQRTRALNLIHQSFFSEFKCLSLFVIGAGRVGKALLQQLHQQQAAMLEKKIHITVCAISNSKKMILNPRGIHLENWEAELASSVEPANVEAMIKLLPQVECSHVALVDCTASDAIVDMYPLFVQENIHIITPNKRANVLPYEQWKDLMDQFKRRHCHFLCRTNVGAGLPILTVLEDLIACGDTIFKIEGIISGTLSYLFNHFDGSQPFGKVLQKAQDLGMTEPDPREDLSGIDVARKLLILARQMGWQINLSDIFVENLVPPELQVGPFTNQFFDDYKLYADSLDQRLKRCQSEHKVLRYVGSLSNHAASAQLIELSKDHPLALSTHSDNIIAFTTHHYHQSPLIIRGPGAGVECTALGVFSDILKLISYLPS